MIGSQEMQIAGEKLVLGETVRRFLGEISIWICRWAKQIALPNVSGIIQSTEGKQRPKTEESLNSLSAGLNKLAHLSLIWVLLVFSHSDPHWNLYNMFSDSQALQLHHRLSWVSCLKNINHGTSQAPQPCEAILFNKCLSRFILLALFLWQTFINILSN